MRKVSPKDVAMPQTLVLTAETALALVPGDRVVLATAKAPEYAACLTAPRNAFPRQAVGTVLTPPTGAPMLRILALAQRPGHGDAPATPMAVADCLTPGSLPAGETAFTSSKTGPGHRLDHLERQGQPGTARGHRRPGHRRGLRRPRPLPRPGPYHPRRSRHPQSPAHRPGPHPGLRLHRHHRRHRPGPPAIPPPKPPWPSSNAACPASKPPCSWPP